MSLTPEQQSQVDLEAAFAIARVAGQTELTKTQSKVEAIRIAQTTLIENARTKPVGSPDITAADITAFADTLVAYVNA
jgi:hypothetical protein